MVPRTRLLLITGFLACKAESLGVEVPRGGREAVSQEDLSRDTWMFLDGEAGPFESRLQQMHALPAFGSAWRPPTGSGVVCGLKTGRGGEGVVVGARVAGRGAQGDALPRAVVVSLAKSWDVPEPPPLTLVFCAFEGRAGLDAYAREPAFPLDRTRAVVLVGPLAAGLVEFTDGTPLGTARVVEVGAGNAPGTGAEDDRPEKVDYRVLAEQVRAIHDWVGSVAEGG